MVKIAAKDAESFAKTPPGPELRAVLVYGPDAGLVAERAKALAAGAAGDLDDPFRLIQLGAEQLAGDPARLADEAAALSFSGGRRVVWVRGAGDGLAGACKDFVAERPGEALVVLEAGDLPARSALRKLFESAGPGVAALPCYRDEARDLEGEPDAAHADLQLLPHGVVPVGQAIEPGQQFVLSRPRPVEVIGDSLELLCQRLHLGRQRLCSGVVVRYIAWQHVGK